MSEQDRAGPGPGSSGGEATGVGRPAFDPPAAAASGPIYGPAPPSYGQAPPPPVYTSAHLRVTTPPGRAAVTPAPEPVAPPFPTPSRLSPASEASRAGVTTPVTDAIRRATWTRRAPALLIDIAPNLVAAIVLGIAYVNFLLTVLHEPDNGAVPAGLGTAATMAVVGGVLALLALGWTFFNRWLRCGRTGQSLGKRALKIRLVSELTGSPIGAFQAFVRDLVHILDALTCVGYLWPLWDERRQTFADMLMNTMVMEVLPSPGSPAG